MKISRRVVRVGLVAVGVVALFTVIGFFALPPIVRAQLEKRGSAALGRRVTVEKVRLNPYALSITIENLAVQEQDPGTRFLGWRSLYVNFDALSSLRGEWVLSEVALDGFGARGVVNADKSLNVSDLIARFSAPSANAPAKSSPPRPVRVGHLRVTDARVDFIDLARSGKFATTVGPLTFDLTNFRTVGERGAPYRFQAVTEAGEKLAWSGTLRAAPFQSAGEFSIENVVLAKYAPYYADLLRARISSGTLSVNAAYRVDLAGDQPAAVLERGSVQLRDFALLAAGMEKPVVEMSQLTVTNLQADSRAMKAAIESVTVEHGSVRVRRDRDGKLNLLALLALPEPGTSSPAPAASANAAPATPSLQLTVGEVALRNGALDLEDFAAPRPAHVALGNVQFALKNVTLAPGAKMPLEASFAWAPQGAVKVSGSVGLFPVALDLATEVAGMSLLPVSPYLEEFAAVRLTQGSISAKLRTEAAMLPQQPVTASLSGDVAVEEFGLVDAANNEELAGFKAVKLTGVRAQTAPQLKASVEQVEIGGPYARLIVLPNQALNVSGLTPARTTTPAVTAAAVAALPAKPAAPAAAPAATAAGPQIDIGGITISGGDFRFTDRSITPAVNLAVADFGGTIGALSSTNPSRGEVALHAVVDGAGPIAVSGRVDPLGAKPVVDLKLDIKNVDLQPFSPYAGKYAGYELARGKLLVDVKVAVDGKRVDSSNVITLNQFTFGSAVQSPDATKLPVRLAVALLKDLDGRIVIDLPVQGSMDDPEFRIGRVVLRVVVNLLTKAAVSPFALLGSAFGGGGDELAYQEFAPGEAALQPPEIKKLETMVKALTNRPGLNLDLEGSYDAAADAYALKRAKLEDRVRRAVWQARHATDPNIAPPDKLVISADERAAMVKKLFDEAFPPGTEFGTPLPAAPQVVAPPAPPPGGLIRRVWDTVTFSSQRAKKLAADQAARAAAEHKQAVDTALTQGRPLEEMSGRLAEAIVISDDDLRALAQARARSVRDYFVETGKIPSERLFLARDSASGDRQLKGPRVFLNLQ